MTRQRVTVAEAARLFGISQDAVRMRIKRGKLKADKEGNRLFVCIDTDQTTIPQTARSPSDEPRLELLERYRDEVAFLRRELERRDQLLAAALSRIPEASLETPSEPPGGPERAASPGPRERPFTEEERAQEPIQRRWWEFWR